MRFPRYLLLACCLLGFLLSGCGGGEPVRHLSSDVCLLSPGKMTQKDVVTYMGEPDKRQTDSDGRLVWIYYAVRKSTLRKAPLLGDKLGYEEYDVVTVTFDGETMQACVYRSYTEKEFAGLGIVEQDKEEEK